MEIRLNHLHLVRGHGYQEKARKFRIRTQKDVEVTSMLRSPAAYVFDRGNMKTLVSFESSRRHNSEAAAMDFAMNHGTMLSGENGDAFFEISGQRYLLRNAAVRNVNCIPDGVKTHQSYELIGSQLVSLDLKKEV